MMLMLMGATPMLQGVMEEKTQRIAEVLLGAATAWEILLGKLVGNTLVTLTALAFYLATALTSLSALRPPMPPFPGPWSPGSASLPCSDS